MLLRHHFRPRVPDNLAALFRYGNHARCRTQAHQHQAITGYRQAVNHRPVATVKDLMNREIFRIQMLPGAPFPDHFTVAIDLFDDVALNHAVRRITSWFAAGHTGSDIGRQRRRGGIQQITVRQPLRIMVMEDVFIVPDDFVIRRHFVEITAMPEIPRGIEIRGGTVATVISQVTVRQQHRIAPCTYRQLPLMRHLALFINQINPPFCCLRGKEGIPAETLLFIDKGEPGWTASKRKSRILS